VPSPGLCTMAIQTRLEDERASETVDKNSAPHGATCGPLPHTDERLERIKGVVSMLNQSQIRETYPKKRARKARKRRERWRCENSRAGAKLAENGRDSQATTFASQVHIEMWVAPTEEGLIQLRIRKVNATNESSESVLVPGPADRGVLPFTLDEIEIPRAEVGQSKTNGNQSSITDAPLRTSEMEVKRAEDSHSPDGRPVHRLPLGDGQIQIEKIPTAPKRSQIKRGGSGTRTTSPEGDTNPLWRD
jgi:hypothetical protein